MIYGTIILWRPLMFEEILWSINNNNNHCIKGNESHIIISLFWLWMWIHKLFVLFFTFLSVLMDGTFNVILWSLVISYSCEVSVLLKAQVQLVVRSCQFHQRFLDPQCWMSHLAVLMPALCHQLTKTKQNLVMSPPLRYLRSVLVHTHNLVHVLKSWIWGNLDK